MRLSLISLVCFLSFTACRQSTVFSDDEKTQVEFDVRQTLENYCNDIRKWGLIAEFRYLDSSAAFFWVPPGYPAAISYDSVAAVLRLGAPKYRQIDNVFDTLRIFPLSREVAIYTGRLHSKMTDTSGNTTSFRLVETGVLVKRMDGWKLLSGQTSLINDQQ